jgi:predicted pyridoxine 5'-phosphate oxidase superfamily flavin-nucleotide-binding protein
MTEPLPPIPPPEPAAALSPWHAGERAMQARLGLAGKMEQIGRVTIRDFMPDQHRAFFAQLPFLVVGSVDGTGMPTASLLAGPPGFAASPDPHRLDVAARPLAGDPLAAALAPGAPVGLLGIELPTRRRNRMNGYLLAVGARGFSVGVDQSFGNCPQYIPRRHYLPRREGAAPHVEPLAGLDEAAGRLIGRADSFFVASADAPGRGVDVAHRGGRPGFVGIEGDGALLVPDFRGNRYFNTLGNLLVHPQAGLLFPDFQSGDLLQIEGATEILFEGPLLGAYRGAERLWRLRPARARWLRRALPFRLALDELSPQSLRTGSWEEARAMLEGDRG